MTSTIKKKLLSCPNCDLTVARPSHLARHLQSHLPPTHREHFSCSECGRQFSRNDVLLRHLRTAHQACTSHKRSAQKSCFRCVRKKLKCDRAQPCRACSKSSVPCKYPVAESKGDLAVAEVKEATEQPSARYQRGEISVDTTFAQAMAYQPHSESQHALVHGTASYVQNTAQESPSLQSFNACNPFFHSTKAASPLNMISPAIVSYHNTSPNDTVNEFHQTVEFDGAYFPDDLSFMRCNTAPKVVGMAEGGVDWLNLDLDQPSYGDYLGRPSGQLVHIFGSQSTPQQFFHAGFDGMVQTRMHQVSAPRLEPIRKNGMDCGKGSKPQRVTQQWPFDHTRNPEPQKYQLPPLRDILQGAISYNEPDNGATMRSLIQLLSAPYLPEIDLVHDPSMLSAMDLLKNSLDLYFSEFHSVLPVIHLPTFDMAKVPTVTLAAMSCIGAMYSDDRQGTEQSWSLSEMCLQMIAWLGGSDSTNFYHTSYLTACCLHQIYSLGSGNRRLYQNADCSRGMLIGRLRGMGLLKSCVSTEVEVEDPRGIVSLDNVSSEWLKWKEQEQEKRLAWAAFEYDCSLCTLTSRRGAVDITELPSHLPCAEPLWDAPSAQAWAALYCRLSSIARGASMAETLRNLVAGKTIPGDVPAWSKRLCAQSIGRLLWDMKQLDIMSSSEYLRLPTISAAQRQTKAVLLKGLNAICESMYCLTSTVELIHYNITSLICHYSHLYSADEAMDLVVHIFRAAASQSKQSLHSLESARSRLSAILVKNPQEARNLAWHAAQIIAVANEYLVSAPCEIMRVFMGYIFVLAFARFGPRPINADFEAMPVRLDLANRIQGQRSAIAAWVEVGGPASIGCVGNIYSEGGLKAIAQEAQTMLRKMRYWGLARIFIRILESFDLTHD